MPYVAGKLKLINSLPYKKTTTLTKIMLNNSPRKMIAKTPIIISNKITPVDGSNKSLLHEDDKEFKNHNKIQTETCICLRGELKWME